MTEMSALAKALKATLTKDELKALVNETGTMTSPEVITLAREIFHAMDLHTSDEIQSVIKCSCHPHPIFGHEDGCRYMGSGTMRG